MQALNDWPAPWPPPSPISGPFPLPRSVVMTIIFKRTMILAMVGGMGTGLLSVLEGGDAGIMIPVGAVVGFPLGIVAGCVLAVAGGLLLVPYRGRVVAIVTISGSAFALVTMYLSLLLGGMAAVGRSEGQPDTGAPAMDWLLASACLAAPLLSPWVVWWYVKRMESSRRDEWAVSPL